MQFNRAKQSMILVTDHADTPEMFSVTFPKPDYTFRRVMREAVEDSRKSYRSHVCHHLTIIKSTEALIDVGGDILEGGHGRRRTDRPLNTRRCLNLLYVRLGQLTKTRVFHSWEEGRSRPFGWHSEKGPAMHLYIGLVKPRT